jgi:hypothetical protein
VALHRELDGAEPGRPQPVERVGGRFERRRAETWQLATGTLACPACDVPVLPGPDGLSPGETIACGFCGEVGAVHDFLSLAEPTRPTRVVVRIRGLALR